MISSIINCENYLLADIILVSAGYDCTSSFRKGSAKGPKNVIECLDKQIEFFERITATSPVDFYKISHLDLGDLNKLPPKKMVNKIEKIYKELLDRKKFILLLGGEHTISNGPFRAIAHKNSPEKVTIFQIDAHLDLREDDSDYNETSSGKYAHSTVMRRAVELGFKTVQVGIRAYSKDEYDFAREQNLTLFEWGRGEIPSLNSIIESIKTERVYLTIDIDGIDPAHMPATGTPVQGGLEWQYTMELLKNLFQEKDIIGVDIVEIAPRPGDVLTEYGTAQLCYTLIAFKALKANNRE